MSTLQVLVRYPNLGIKVPVEVLRVISSRSADWILDMCPSMLLWLSMILFQLVVMVTSFELDHQICRFLEPIIALYCIWIPLRKVTLSNKINRSILFSVCLLLNSFHINIYTAYPHIYIRFRCDCGTVVVLLWLLVFRVNHIFAGAVSCSMRQSFDCPVASVIALRDMGKIIQF